MAYLVRITARGERDLARLFNEIDAESSRAALNWYRGLQRAVFSLEKLPNRCSTTPENPKLRHLLYGHKPHIYRIIYRVANTQKRVEIIHIRHGAMRPFKPADLR